MKDKTKIYFYYERMEPMKYPEPRDLRMKLQTIMCKKYNGKSLSKIPLGTELILKSLKRNDIEYPLLKYKVVIMEWEETRHIKDIIFEPKMFRWIKDEEHDYEPGCEPFWE